MHLFIKHLWKVNLSFSSFGQDVLAENELWCRLRMWLMSCKSHPSVYKIEMSFFGSGRKPIFREYFSNETMSHICMWSF